MNLLSSPEIREMYHQHSRVSDGALMYLRHFLPIFSIMETRGLMFCLVKIPWFDHRGPVPSIPMNTTCHFQCPLFHSSPHPLLVDMSGLPSTPAAEWPLPSSCTLPCSSPCELPAIYQFYLTVNPRNPAIHTAYKWLMSSPCS